MSLPAPHPAEVDRLAILVSRYHERVTSRLLTGALDACREAGITDDQIDVVSVAGAFELGVVAAAVNEADDTLSSSQSASYKLKRP